jgi:hypothetical protein
LPPARARTRAARAFDRRSERPGSDRHCESKRRLIYPVAGIGPANGEVAMAAMRSWFLTVVAVLGLVLVLHHLGVDVTGAIGSTVRSAEQILGRPLVTF